MLFSAKNTQVQQMNLFDIKTVRRFYMSYCIYANETPFCPVTDVVGLLSFL